MPKVDPKNTLISRINVLEDELNRLKFEVLKSQYPNEFDEQQLADQIVQEVSQIRQRLYQEKYGQKTARLS